MRGSILYLSFLDIITPDFPEEHTPTFFEYKLRLSLNILGRRLIMILAISLNQNKSFAKKKIAFTAAQPGR